MGESAKKQELGTVLRFDRTLGTDELNLAEFPLAALAHRLDPNQRTLSFEDEIYDEGNQQPVHRKLVISASDHFGLPTPLDSDVLLVLLYITNARNGLTERKISFSRYEIVKMLSWDPGGKSYKRLDEALNRWASVTLYYNHAWWDRSGRKWRSRTFHVIESLDLRGRDDRGDDLLSSFTWNDVLFASLESKNIKRLNLELYFRLKNAAAKQAYRFLDKRFYRSHRLEFDLRTFACEHVGFSRTYDAAQLKRRLQPAIEELEEIGFLEPVSMTERYRKRGRGDWVIALAKAASNAHTREASTEMPSIAEKLVARGIATATAAELMRAFPEGQIEQQISLHDWLVERKDRRAAINPAGFLAKAIRQNYPLPKDYPTNVQKCSARANPIKHATAAKQMIVPDDATTRFRAFWTALSEADRNAFEAEAIANGDRFKVGTYWRLVGTNGQLFAQVREALLIEHANSTGALLNHCRAD